MTNEPPVAPVLQSGTRYCKFHPKSYARWLCNKCNRTFCDLCVISRQQGAVTKKTCRTCGVEVLPLQVTVVKHESKGFFASLPATLIYPFRGSGVLVLIVSTIVFA